MGVGGTPPGPPANSFILQAADGADLVVQAWLPGGPIRQVLLTTIEAGASAARVRSVSESCADVGVATFALLSTAGPATRGRRARALGRVAARFRPRPRDERSELLAWLRMLYRGVPVWVIGDQGEASLVAASPAEARRIVRRAAALT